MRFFTLIILALAFACPLSAQTIERNAAEVLLEECLVMPWSDLQKLRDAEVDVPQDDSSLTPSYKVTKRQEVILLAWLFRGQYPNGEFLKTAGEAKPKTVEETPAPVAVPIFECKTITRDPMRYGAPTAVFQRCDGIAGNLQVSGSHLMGMDGNEKPITVGDKFRIDIQRITPKQ